MDYITVRRSRGPRAAAGRGRRTLASDHPFPEGAGPPGLEFGFELPPAAVGFRGPLRPPLALGRSSAVAVYPDEVLDPSLPIESPLAGHATTS